MIVFFRLLFFLKKSRNLKNNNRANIIKFRLIDQTSHTRNRSNAKICQSEHIFNIRFPKSDRLGGVCCRQTHK